MKSRKLAITKKHERKIVWLERRWKKTEAAVPEIVRDIRVADDDLPSEFESTPRVYGGVQLDEEEQAALELSPKYGLFRRLNVEQGKVDVEEGFNKLRWNAIFQERDGRPRGGSQAGVEGQEEGEAASGGRGRVSDETQPKNHQLFVAEHLYIQSCLYTILKSIWCTL